MTSRLTIRRPGRAATVVGAVIAVGATTALALLAGPASADEPGRCVENVNVRAEPNSMSRIVALCEAGTRVQLGETRDGFVRLTDLGGWSAAEFVSADRPGAGAVGTAVPTEITASRPRPVGVNPDAPSPQPTPGARGTGRTTAPTSARTTPRATPRATPAPLPRRVRSRCPVRSRCRPRWATRWEACSAADRPVIACTGRGVRVWVRTSPVRVAPASDHTGDRLSSRGRHASRLVGDAGRRVTVAVPGAASPSGSAAHSDSARMRTCTTAGT